MRTLPFLLAACAATLVATSTSADVTSYCSAGVNSTGQAAVLSWSGPINAFGGALHVQGLPANAAGVVVYGTGQQQTPFGGGFLCTTPGWILARKAATAGGTLDLDIYAEGEDEDVRWLTSGLLAGANFQYLYRDPVGGGINATDALAVLFE